ncbi:hypothetical protein HDU97_001930 [Phlyctochytrium planicorne]|nr:hypothetical protein HDU97_001930 [Phlyctochytrium planicorne]
MCTQKWKPCPLIDDSRITCGTLLVPFNYTTQEAPSTLHSNSTHFKLHLSRFQHPSTLHLKNRISIVVNPGGPGGAGASWVQSSGESLWTTLAGSTNLKKPLESSTDDDLAIDIIGFDPRGIGKSHPVLCFDSPFAHTAFEKEVQGVGIPGFKGSDASLKSFAAFQEARGLSCLRNDGKEVKEKDGFGGSFLEHVSTALTARDMDLIRENLGEDKLNFFGVSYGTFLGATYVNMFPDNVGRVVLDGVVNPVDFTNTKSDMFAGSVLHIEEILDEFGRLCQEAGPTRCALAPNTTTTATSSPSTKSNAVTDLIRKALSRLAAHPIPVHDLPLPTVVNSIHLASLLFQGTYRPPSWPLIAHAIAALRPDLGSPDFDSPHPPEANAKLLAILTSSPMTKEEAEGEVCALPERDQSGAEGFPAVYCNDSEDERDVPLEEWERWAERMDGVSPTIGRLFFYGAAFQCKYWPVRPVERYAGPWNKKLSNKILIIGNTLDPVTPLESAQALEKYMEGNGVLLHHDGMGHVSLAQPGMCTIAALRNYFRHNVLPEAGTKCPNDSPAFPLVQGRKSVEEAVKGLGVSGMVWERMGEKWVEVEARKWVLGRVGQVEELKEGRVRVEVLEEFSKVLDGALAARKRVMSF